MKLSLNQKFRQSYLNFLPSPFLKIIKRNTCQQGFGNWNRQKGTGLIHF